MIVTNTHVRSGGQAQGPLAPEKEEAVQKDIFDGLAPDERTVHQLVKAHTNTRTGVWETTRTGYRTVLNLLRKDEFRNRRITDAKTVDAKRWLIRKTPFSFELSAVIVNDSARREALTCEQEGRFLHFVRYDDHYNRYFSTSWFSSRLACASPSIAG